MQKRPGRLLQILGSDRGFLAATELPGSMLRHGFSCVATWFYVLSYGKSRNMAFFYCDRVTGSPS